MEIEIIQIIIQGGAVGLAAFAMYIILQLVSKHIHTNTIVLTKNTEMLSGLKETIHELTILLRRNNGH